MIRRALDALDRPAPRLRTPLLRASRAGRGATQLTGRGGVLAVFGACFTGLLISDWLDWGEFANAVFFMASSLTAYYVRPGSLLPVVVSPPLLFLAAGIAMSAITSSGMLAGLEGLIVTLAGAAWWMLGGMVATVGIAAFRGLHTEVAALLADLRGW
jgi:hypothetical protein